MGEKLSVLGYVEPVCPKGFKDEVISDIEAFGQPGPQSHTDESTRKTIYTREGNQLLGGVFGVVWNDHYAITIMIHLRGLAPKG
jgi:hypothetical protein